MDPYSTLEVPHDATIQDIKKAYRRLAKLWHPDKNGGSLDAAEMFRKIKAAFDLLMDPIKRADAKPKCQEQAESAQKVKAEADRQSRARGYTHSAVPISKGISPLTIGLALVAVLVIIVALFRSNESASIPTSA